MDTDLKNQVLQFILAEYNSTGEVPSLSRICREIDGLYSEKFYKLFSGGIGEATRLAGVPEPSERLRKTEAATEAKAAPPERAKSEGPRVTLTEEQSKRLFGLSHLESGRDVSILVDEILKRDEELRAEGMNLEQTRQVFDYIKELRDHGWSVNEFLQFVNNLTVRVLLPMLSPSQANDLIAFLQEPNPQGLSIGQRVDELALGLRVKRLWEMKERGEITRTQLLEALAR